MLMPLTAANQPQAPPEFRAAFNAIGRHVNDYADRGPPSQGSPVQQNSGVNARSNPSYVGGVGVQLPLIPPEPQLPLMLRSLGQMIHQVSRERAKDNGCNCHKLRTTSTAISLNGPEGNFGRSWANGSSSVGDGSGPVGLGRGAAHREYVPAEFQATQRQSGGLPVEG